MPQGEREVKGSYRYPRWWAIASRRSHSEDPPEGIGRWTVSFGMSDRGPPGRGGCGGIEPSHFPGGRPIGSRNIDDQARPTISAGEMMDTYPDGIIHAQQT